MYSGKSKCLRLFLTDESDQSLNASQRPTIIFLRREEVNSCVNTMSKHRRMKELRQREIRSEKDDGLSGKNRLILPGDFAENWAIIQQDAI